MERIYRMKNIYKKIFFSPFFLLIIFISLISGLFKDVIVLFFIIMVHEAGHVLVSTLFGWDIKRIDITIAGGFITYDEEIDKPFKEEILIAIAGFLFQGLLFIICALLNHFEIINNKLFFMINKYNISIFLFNVLPIVPLDGSKLLLTFFSMFLPYKKSLKLINVVSALMLLVVIIYFLLFNEKIEYGYIITISFVISKIIHHIKDVPYLFNRLLFERFLYGTSARNYVYVKDGKIDSFRRRKKHYFLIGKHYYDEKFVLSKRFD